MFRLSPRLDCSQQSTDRKKALLAFCLLSWLNCDNSLQISSSPTECLPQEWDGFSGLLMGLGLGRQQQERRCYIKVISLPLFEQNKIQAYLSVSSGVGWFVVTINWLTPALFQPPQRLALFTRWAVWLINGRMFGIVCRWTRMQITQFWNFNLEWIYCPQLTYLKSSVFFFPFFFSCV